jgi:phospholipase/carboxylesterase
MITFIKNKCMVRRLFMLLVAVWCYTGVSAQELQQGLALQYLVRQPVQKTAHPPVLILLHGYGSDERDLFGLKDAVSGNFLVISARAPMALPGAGYEWYEPSKQSGHRDADAAQLAASRALIEKFISQVVAKYNADGRQVFLAGFSQGAIMSYQVGLTRPGLLRGICVLSGTIFPSLKPLVKQSPQLAKLKIFVGHGTSDDRIPFGEGKDAVSYLTSIGLTPEFHTYQGMGHTITNDVMKDLVQWLVKE